MPINLHSLYIYPIKSCHGIRVDSAKLINTGLQYDRQWMLVDDEGQFLSQRQQAKMATIHTRLNDQTLTVSHDGIDDLDVPLQPAKEKSAQVHIWDDQCRASIVSEQANVWFSQVLGQSCRLVMMPANELRQVDPRYAKPGQIVGFADGFPLLVMTLETSRALGEKLGENISIERFRPNIVIDGSAAHAEDEWKTIIIDDVIIDLVKPCSRCVIPSIDQDSAQKHPSLLKTLAGYRRRDGKVYVGQNGLHRSNGIISTAGKVFIEQK